MRVDVGVEKLPQLRLVERERDLPAAFREQALEVLGLPPESDPLCLPPRAVRRNPLDVEQQVDRLVGLECLLDLGPLNRGDERSVASGVRVDEADAAAARGQAASFGFCAAERNGACPR